MERTLYIFAQADGSRRHRAHCTFPSHMLSLCGLSTVTYTLSRIGLTFHPQQMGCATSSKLQCDRCTLVRVHDFSRVHDSVNTAIS